MFDLAVLGPEFFGNANARRGTLADPAHDGRFEDGLHALQHAFGRLCLVEPDRREDIQHLAGVTSATGTSPISGNTKVSMVGPLIQMLGVGQLLGPLGERNFEHAPKCGARNRPSALLDADIDACGRCTLDRKGFGTRLLQRNLRAGSQAPFDPFAIDGDADNPAF